MMMMMYFAFFVSDWLWQTSPSIFLLSLLCFRSITCYTPRLPVSYLNDAAMYMCLTLARAMSNVACVFPFSLSLSTDIYIYIYIYICMCFQESSSTVDDDDKSTRRIEITYLSSFSAFESSAVHTLLLHAWQCAHWM